MKINWLTSDHRNMIESELDRYRFAIRSNSGQLREAANQYYVGLYVGTIRTLRDLGVIDSQEHDRLLEQCP